MLTAEEIEKMVAIGETVSVEFKRARGGIPADFWPTYSSFANTDGGTVVLGVLEKDGVRTVEGVADAEKCIADLWNAVNNPDKVSANVLFGESAYPVDVGGRVVVVVDVPRADRTARPVYVGADVFKGTYRRNGEGDYHCPRETVEGMIRDKCAETADNSIIEELPVSGLDGDSVRRYRMLFSQLRPGHIWSGLSDEGFLMKIGAAARGRDGNVHPTLAGLVCFGEFNEITNVLPHFFLDYRERLSPEVRWTDRTCSGDAGWSGNILDFFFRISQSITAGVKVPFRISSDNVTRDDDTSVHKALREVLANALIHADYHGRRGIVIDKYPKRLEVSNPGAMRVSKSVAIAGGTSDARNGKIFNIFSLVRIGERSGMGLSSLYGVWEKEGFAEPVIEESYEPDRTKVVVEFEAEDGEVGEKAVASGGCADSLETTQTTAQITTQTATQTTAQTTAQSGERSDCGSEDVTPVQSAIMEYLRGHPRSSRREVAKNCGVEITEDGVKYHLAKLQERGMLRRCGADFGGYWEVLWRAGAEA